MHELQAALFRNLLAVIAVVAACAGCTSEQVALTTPDAHYSFFAAGHVYGKPDTDEVGLYPPFLDFADALNADEKFALGVLTGDVVQRSDAVHWDAAVQDMQRFEVPVLIAPGNHDRGPEFQQRFGAGFLARRVENDLLIVLDTFGWQIDDVQQMFLTQLLKKHSDTRNVFVFVHELIWWSPDNEYAEVQINNRRNWPGSSNFWSEIAPILQDVKQQVVIYAGDLGAQKESDYTFFDQSGNLTLVASGMGGGTDDNFIVTEVAKDGRISFHAIRLADGSRTLLGSVGGPAAANPVVTQVESLAQQSHRDSSTN